MDISKLSWIIRAVLNKPLFKSIKMPSYIGKPIYISNKRKIKIGKNTRIYPGIRIETVDHNSSIVFGNNVSIGQNCHFVSYDDELYIGDNCTLSANVFVSNVDHSYEILGRSVLQQELIKKKTRVSNNCFIGYGSVILPGTVLGDNCIVGANSVVKGVYPSNCVIVGNPARVIKRYDFQEKKWLNV